MRLPSFCLGVLCVSLCAAQPANQTGIAHVAFRVADVDAARTFYNTLGFEQAFDVKQGEKVTQVFLKVNDHQFIELYPRTDAAQPLGLMHVCYESGDLEAVHAEYANRGLTMSEVRKAGAGNLLMTMKDPEGQTIEYTQYLPGSRHFEDRGKHLGSQRIAEVIVGATAPAKDLAAMRTFYVEKLGFTAVNQGDPARLKMPGISGHKLNVSTGAAGVQFGVPDVQATASALRKLRLAPFGSANMVSVTDPDGVVVSFVRY